MEHKLPVTDFNLVSRAMADNSFVSSGPRKLEDGARADFTDQLAADRVRESNLGTNVYDEGIRAGDDPDVDHDRIQSMIAMNSEYSSSALQCDSLWFQQ